MIILIPSYEPTMTLISVVSGLRAADPAARIVVVNDGSGPAFAPVFAAARKAGAEVLEYGTNMGKGHALKTGFRHVLEAYPGEDVVCADSDGQHRTDDILRVAERVASTQGAMVLGGRQFTGTVPLRSRIGNLVASHAFLSTTGVSIGDTQTGLRGFPASMLPWLVSVRGERFDYEINMLVDSSDNDLPIDEVLIDTVYLDHNASSHFRPIIDSARVMLPFLAFALVSLASFIIDLVALQSLFALTGSLLASVVGARLLSGTVNFSLNRRLVFGGETRGSLRRDALRYVVLAAVMVAASYLLLSALIALGVGLVISKLIADSSLYVASFVVQRQFVFRRRSSSSRATPASQTVVRMTSC